MPKTLLLRRYQKLGSYRIDNDSEDLESYTSESEPTRREDIIHSLADLNHQPPSKKRRLYLPSNNHFHDKDDSNIDFNKTLENVKKVKTVESQQLTKALLKKEHLQCNQSSLVDPKVTKFQNNGIGAHLASFHSNDLPCIEDYELMVTYSKSFGNLQRHKNEKTTEESFQNGEQRKGEVCNMNCYCKSKNNDIHINPMLNHVETSGIPICKKELIRRNSKEYLINKPDCLARGDKENAMTHKRDNECHEKYFLGHSMKTEGSNMIQCKDDHVENENKFSDSFKSKQIIHPDIQYEYRIIFNGIALSDETKSNSLFCKQNQLTDSSSYNDGSRKNSFCHRERNTKDTFGYEKNPLNDTISYSKSVPRATFCTKKDVLYFGNIKTEKEPECYSRNIMNSTTRSYSDSLTSSPIDDIVSNVSEDDFEKPFSCTTCGKCFRLSSTLCRHKIIHTTQRPHKCAVCSKSFNRSSTLKTHMKTHSPTKDFICNACGKGFHQKGNLRNHILIHTGEKPYTCNVCAKSFNKLSNLKFHMHIHTDQKPYRCRFCKLSFSRRGELKQHIKTFHFEENEACR